MKGIYSNSTELAYKIFCLCEIYNCILVLTMHYKMNKTFRYQKSWKGLLNLWKSVSKILHIAHNSGIPSFMILQLHLLNLARNVP